MACPSCGNKENRSPTGDWCNNCGWQNPCQCQGGDCAGCLDHMNSVRKKNRLALVESCCCGRLDRSAQGEKP